MQARIVDVFARVRQPLIFSFAAVVLFFAWIGLDGSLAGWEPDRLPPLELSSLGDRILVIAPHPDDETLAAGGLVQDAVASGRRVLVCVVTCGDGYRRILPRYLPRGTSDTAAGYAAMGEARAAESRAALETLGLKSADVVFLGYPDGSLTRLWNDDWAAAGAVQAANGRSEVPYRFAYRYGAAYTGGSLASDLASVVAGFAPTSVVFPDAEDANGDHWAVNAFTQLTLDRGGFSGLRLSYLVHRGHFPFPWSYLPRGLLEPPPTLRRVGVTWHSFALDRGAERRKEEAIHHYASQRSVMEPFLDAFVRRNELFAVSEPVEGTTCPPALRDKALEATRMPGTIVLDPSADTLLRILNAQADIRDVALVRSGDQVLLGLRVKGKVGRDVSYRLAARLVGHDGTIRRADIEVKRGTASWRRVGVDSVMAETPPGLRVSGDRLWVALPAAPFQAARETLLYAETFEAGFLVDRSAARSARIP